MHIEWNKVTWYSKLVAVIVFLLTFWIAFCLGIKWNQAHIDASLTQAPVEETGAPVVGQGAHCGGFIKDAPVCAAGLHCQLKVSMPDTGGTCVKN